MMDDIVAAWPKLFFVSSVPDTVNSTSIPLTIYFQESSRDLHLGALMLPKHPFTQALSTNQLKVCYKSILPFPACVFKQRNRAH